LKNRAKGAAQEHSAEWNANLYDAKHAFVWKYGSDVVSLLAPQPGERILDLGCGTGHLTAQIADLGAQVLGIDFSPEMIAAACEAFPNLNFQIADARKLPFQTEFDAVFSNAALHWILQPGDVIQSVWNALVQPGRFVVEFGGKGNITKMQSAFDQSLAELHLARPGEIKPWYYPTPGDYATLLENSGFEVRFMTLFDRPTGLSDGEAGMRNWITMFASDYLSKVNSEARERFFRRVEELLRPELFREGQWWADYRRLRFVAYK
jgi:trans-aconitate methyltransferase